MALVDRETPLAAWASPWSSRSPCLWTRAPCACPKCVERTQCHRILFDSDLSLSPYRSGLRFCSKLKRAARVVAVLVLRCRPAARARPTACQCVPRELWIQHIRRPSCSRRVAGSCSARERSHGQHHEDDVKTRRCYKRASGTSPARVWRTAGHPLLARHTHSHSYTRA